MCVSQISSGEMDNGEGERQGILVQRKQRKFKNYDYPVQFFKAADELWKPGITAGAFSDGDYVLKTNFLLITPIDKDYHKSVGKHIINSLA